MNKFYSKIKSMSLRPNASLALFTLLLTYQANAQCPPGDVIFVSQAEVNAFAVNYPNCTQISGHLTFSAPSNGTSNITDLSPLSNITHVDRNFNIADQELLQSLNGLNITSVGWTVFIGGNNASNDCPILSDISALSSLTNIGTSLYIQNNPSLSDISGLQNINTVSGTLGYISIKNNPLVNVCNLPNFCSYLANPVSSHPREFADNAPGCFDEQEVVDACNAPPPQLLAA